MAGLMNSILMHGHQLAGPFLDAVELLGTFVFALSGAAAGVKTRKVVSAGRRRRRCAVQIHTEKSKSKENRNDAKGIHRPSLGVRNNTLTRPVKGASSAPAGKLFPNSICSKVSMAYSL
jgi:hypothetical protein